MSRSTTFLDRFLPAGHHTELVVLGLGTHVACNIVAALAFRYAALSASALSFLAWQIVGNLAGLATVLAVTVLLRFLPLSLAYPVTTGLSVIGVQVVAARFLLHESLPPHVWLGTALIVIGILLVGGRV